jgi:hypothetical protein
MLALLSSDSESDGPSEPPRKQAKKAGRPPSIIRTLYIQSKEKRDNRPLTARCIGCGFVHHKNTRLSVLREHSLVCKGISEEAKETIRQERKGKYVAPAATSVGRAERKAGTPSAASSSQMTFSRGCSKAQKAAYDALLARWLAVNGVPLNAVDSSLFLDFITSIEPSYIPAGKCGLGAILCVACTK